MMKKIISQFELGDMTVAYIADDQNVGLLLTPKDMFAQVDWGKEYAGGSIRWCKQRCSATGTRAASPTA